MLKQSKCWNQAFLPAQLSIVRIMQCIYAVLALFIHSDTPHKTSKHSGVIGIFNKEFIHSGKLDARFAKMLYELFDERMELDYRDFAQVSEEDARSAVLSAQEFVTEIRKLTE